jgi:hypothetical protein
MVDEGLPPAVGKIEVKAKKVDLVGMVTPDQKVGFVSAKLHFDITSQTEQGDVTIVRDGELLFAPDPAGAWKISSFRMVARRAGPGVKPAPTTTAAPTAPSTPVAT